MSFRLIRVAVYSKQSGEISEIPINRTGLSIITGRSSRGKSALLDIVDYGLLSKHCSVPKGVIREKVSHIGVLFEGPTGKRLGVVRHLPAEGQLTSTQAHLSREQELPRTPPELRWNIDTAREALSEFAGIEAVPVLTNDESADPDARRPAHIRHCAPYLFQPQDVIASRNVLFPGVEDTWVRRHVSDAVAYFLGLLTVTRLAKRRELQQLLAERNSLRRHEEEREKRSADGWTRGLRLWSDAASLGLSVEPVPTQMDALFAGLQGISLLTISTYDESVKLPRLSVVQKQEADLRNEFRRLMYDLAEVDRLLAGGQAHSSTADTQIARLKVRDLLPPNHPKRCPLCEQGTIEVGDLETRIASTLRSVEGSKLAPKRLSARVEQRKSELESALSKVRSQLGPVQTELRNLFAELNQQSTALEEGRKKQRLIGQISEYLSAVGIRPRNVTDLSLINMRIDELDAEVGERTLKSAKEAAVNQLSTEITKLARDLDVEFPDNAARINFDSFVLEINFGGSWVRLNEIGSGANWIGYHLAAIVALHHQFIALGAPVPSFIMLDQPSQVWFPAEIAALNRTTAPTKDADLNAVRRVYAFLEKAASGPDAPQIIVSDHARLEDEYFKAAVVADWHEGGGLVPSHWE